MLSAHSFPSFFCTIMNASIRKFTFFLTACLLSSLTGHGYEQDNWYLHGPLDGNLTGVFHQEYDAVNKRDMLYKTIAGVGLEVRDLNGTLLQTINTGGITFTDIEYDQNTSRLFGINASKLTCFEQNASGGWSEQWRSTQSVSSLAQSPSGKLFCANSGDKIYVYEQNGTMSNEFGWVDGINRLSSKAFVVGFAPGGVLVFHGLNAIVGGATTLELFFIDETGVFLKKVKICNLSDFFASNYSNGSIHVRIHEKTGLVFRKRYGHHSWGWTGKTFYNPLGDTPTYSGIDVSLWLQNGDFISGSSLYRRTFRTKMDTYHNSVPQPVIHRIAQRAGTNILELDFEVIDTDDDNVTVGILAYCGSDKLVPQAWLNGGGSKIGTPIATNTVHSMEWDVKQDWPNSTGSIKFEILCQDGSRDKPVDLHFLNLPFADGNMTISRSPLKDSDFLNYNNFLLATNSFLNINGKSYQQTSVPPIVKTKYIFTNCGVAGRLGPTQADVNASYAGTNLEGNVTIDVRGIQKWTVPTTDFYLIEAVGGAGGSISNNAGGAGAYVRAKVHLTQGDVLKILVGHEGPYNSANNYGAGGGGGTFVTESNNSALVVAGGGGGAANGKKGYGASATTSGSFRGGLNGSAGQSLHSSKAGSGITGDAGSGSNSFINGGSGSSFTRNGGFGGGGGSGYSDGGGGGGGYSGGGGGGGGGTGGGGGGGSYSVDSNATIIAEANGGHGRVIISLFDAQNISYSNVPFMIFDGFNATEYFRNLFLEELGSNYRFATTAEVTKAREAATPSGVNNWTATNQVKPRNLPGKVNEYGFDVSTTSGFWVIKE